MASRAEEELQDESEVPATSCRPPGETPAIPDCQEPIDESPAADPVEEPADEAFEEAVGETFEDAETEAQLRELIGDTYRGLSMSGVAVPHLERALHLWREVEGPSSRRTVLVAIGLVVALRENGRQADAEQLVESLHDQFSN